MAEEDKPIEEGEETEAKQKGFSKKFIIIGLILLLLGGGGFAGWRFFLAEKPSEKDDEEAVAEAAPSPPPVRIVHEMEPFIVNLFGQKGRRYLKARLELEFDFEAVGEELKDRDSQLRDAILLLLASKTFEDISSPEGKVQLRAELIARINQILKAGAVRTLYFTEFVVQ